MLHLDLTIGARGFQDLRSPSPIMAPGIKHDLEGKWTMKMKSKRGNPQYRPYSRKNPSQVICDLSRFQKSQV